MMPSGQASVGLGGTSRDPCATGPGTEALGHFGGNAGLRQAGKEHADGVNRNTVRPY